MKGISKPPQPIIMNFGNDFINNFREEIKSKNRIVYFVCIFWIIIILSLLFFAQLDWDARLALLLFLIAIPTCIWSSNNYYDNYIYEELKPGVYRAVLKGEGIGKLSKARKLALLQEVFENRREVEIPLSASKKPNKYLPYWIIFFIFLCVLFFAPVKRDLACTVIEETQWYKCEIHSKSVLINFGTKDLGTVNTVLFEGKNPFCQTIQFRGPNNLMTSYMELWSKKLSVEDINKKFKQGKDFNYNFGVGTVYFWILLAIFLFALLDIMRSDKINWKDYIFARFEIIFAALFVHAARMQQKEIENYLLEPIVTPERYRAILKAEGLDNPNEIKFENTLAAVKDEKIINYLKDDELTDMQKEFYDKSWSAKDQAKMDKDVEDLTKQFYDDGK